MLLSRKKGCAARTIFELDRDGLILAFHQHPVPRQHWFVPDKFEQRKAPMLSCFSLSIVWEGNWDGLPDELHPGQQ